MAKATQLSKTDIRNICLKRLGGIQQKVLAIQYDSSVDRILAIQKRNSNIMNLFVKNGSVYELAEKGQLFFTGDLIFADLELTGNDEDGVLYCQEFFPHLTTKETVSNMRCEDNDLGIPGASTLRIGKLYTHSTPHQPISKDHKRFSTQMFEKLSKELGDADFILKEIKKDVIVTKPAPVVVKPQPIEHEYIWNASNKFISISKGREAWNADNSHPKFREALEHLFNDEIEKALDLINIEKAVTEFVEGKIEIKDGILKYENYVLTSGIAKRIVDRMQEGKDFKFFLPFLNNLMENPSEKAVNRLFDFLEANDIEITKDGYFLAYKKVSPDYKDLYTRKIDNSIGKYVSVPRNQVDEDDNVTCSRGLHVCSKSYLNHYGSCSDNKIVMCKVHPKDVVSIPTDYNNAKMRTCGYTVIKDVTVKI